MGERNEVERKADNVIGDEANKRATAIHERQEAAHQEEAGEATGEDAERLKEDIVDGSDLHVREDERDRPAEKSHDDRAHLAAEEKRPSAVDLDL